MRARTSSVSLFIHTLPKWEGLDRGGLMVPQLHIRTTGHCINRSTSINHQSLDGATNRSVRSLPVEKKEVSVSREKEAGGRSQGERMVPRTDVGVGSHMKDKW